MAVDEFIAAVQNEPLQLPVDPEDVVAGENDGVDAKFPGLLSEGAVKQTIVTSMDLPRFCSSIWTWVLAPPVSPPLMRWITFMVPSEKRLVRKNRMW